MSNISKNQGFTLIELSMVIVITSLIIAAVLGGQTLIKQARARSVITDYNKYNAAYLAFSEKYKAFPGDFKIATSYWPSAVNGDGNGLIGDSAISNDEALGVWQHLALAGLIEGNYTGLWGSGAVLGKNAPNVNYSKQATYWVYSGNLWSQYRRGNSMVLSGYSNVNGWNDFQVNIIDAYNIDTKIDDGLPYLGNIITYNNNSGVCVASGSRIEDSPNKQTTAYKISTPADLCTMQFALGSYVFK
jgi:prepilin-type N-terminal cleavage/methylation domain-containing protein